MSYLLRFFDDRNIEVRMGGTVDPLLNAQNYPAVGQMIGDWKVSAIIQHTDREHWVRVQAH